MPTPVVITPAPRAPMQRSPAGWLRWVGPIAAGLVCVGALTAQPRVPDDELFPKPEAAARALAAPVLPMASVGGFSVDPASREQSRLFHRLVYSASEEVPMEWTGNHASTDSVTAAGDTSQARGALSIIGTIAFEPQADEELAPL